MARLPERHTNLPRSHTALQCHLKFMLKCQCTSMSRCMVALDTSKVSVRTVIVHNKAFDNWILLKTVNNFERCCH